jgi:Holliday junction resolvase-like predicted endonuclease
MKFGDPVNVVLCNARSLLPKTESLIDLMNEVNASISICTETWIKEGERAEEFLRDLADNTRYDVLRKSRRTRGGGVAILYDKTELHMTHVKTPETDFEVLATLARRKSQRIKFLTIAVYIPPSYDAEKTDSCFKYIIELISLLKSRYESPYVILGGDFNQKPIKSSFPFP